VYTELFYDIILVSVFFAGLLSLHLVTFLMFFILVEYKVGSGITNLQQQAIWIILHSDCDVKCWVNTVVT